MTINSKQLTIDTAMRTCESADGSPELCLDTWLGHKQVNCQRSIVKGSSLGFTLVETLVAIAILLIGVVTPMSLIGDSSVKFRNAKNEVLAINLAQEGIEAVRQIRDSNMLAGDPWLDNLGSGDYYVNVGPSNPPGNSTSLIKTTAGDCSSTTIPPHFDDVFYHSVDNMYEQCSPTSGVTPFRRVVEINNNGLGGKERKIVSTVSWDTGGGNIKSVSVTENIFNWVP